MKRTVEFHSSDMTGDPAHRALQGLKTSEFHPDSFPDGRTLDKLNLAASGRKIERAHTETASAGTSDCNLGGVIHALGSARFLFAWRVGWHA